MMLPLLNAPRSGFPRVGDEFEQREPLTKANRDVMMGEGDVAIEATDRLTKRYEGLG